jgi:hypothetical protein
MKQAALIAILSFTFFGQAGAQNLTDSNLPIVIINTDGGVNIPDNPRVRATMKIICRGSGQRNYVTDQSIPEYLNYNGRIDIEVRGSSSQYSQKKQYGFSTRKADNITNNNVSLLGMPAENDWILNAMVYDSALIRDYLSYNLSRQIGEYASRTAYCEVIINNSYRGLYILQEKIKPDDERIDILQITPADISLPGVSGGYITKADKTTGGDPVAWTMVSWYGGTVDYIHEFPDPSDVTYQQTNYIHGQFNKLEIAAKNNDISISTGFPSLIDIPSFIDFIIISELGSNADSYQLSTFFHKDRNGKLRAGPIWDNDLTYGNDLFFWGFDRSHTNIWQLSEGGNDGSRFWKDLFNNSQFRCYTAKRWNELIQPGHPLNQSSLETFIDQTVALISEALVRENALWHNVGDHQKRIAKLKSFIGARITWMTTNLGSWSACSNVSVPPLVITKIMYHPESTIYFPDSDGQEFIEIFNNGDQTANLTGIYFGGTGFVYQFPVNSTLNPNSSLFLASNSTIFRSRYGFEPFGQFTRHLSNKSQNLLLSDGFGNVIDNVQYSDTIPWPEADGNGYYLVLNNPNLDNNTPSNWTASKELVLSVDDISNDISLEISPNPVTDVLRIKAGCEIRSLKLFDIQGRMLESVDVGSETFDLEMGHLIKGTYILQVIISGRTYSVKVIRQ